LFRLPLARCGRELRCPGDGVRSRRVGEYAFVRPGREILFSRVDNETKYKAKNVIDVPVYRASDAITAQVSTGLESGTLGVSAVALIDAAIATAWAVNGWWLGKWSETRDV
jgi:AAA family ATP:ADP antiporter